MPGASHAATVRDAATVVLLREGRPSGPDGAVGLEVYLQRRVAEMAFAAGVHVFPGGAADLTDIDLVATAVREVAEETGVQLSPEGVRPWARWITPEGEPRRYDTRFYVAQLPTGLQPAAVGTEMDDAGWWSPSDALAAGERGEIILWPPTWITLTEVAACGDVATVLATAAHRDLEPVLPVLLKDPDGYRVVLPDGRELRR